MLPMLRAHLEKEGVFSGALSPYMHQMTDCVGGAVSYSMKLSIAVSELMLYASQFRRYIKLPADKTPIPINSISFVLAESGANKDRTVKAIRNSLSDGYHKIDIKRKEMASALAIEKAKAEGVEEPDKWENHKSFYRKPATLFAAMTNSAAYIDHLAEMESLPLGAGFMYTGELGSEMETNPDMVPSIRVMSEVYDVGYKEAKPLKDKSAQTPEIKNLAVSALFIGSHENLLFDEKIKGLFKKEFSTKLARRSFFTFSPERIESTAYKNVAEMLEAKARAKDQEMEARDKMNVDAVKIAECNFKAGCGVPLTLEQEAEDVYEIYMAYNDEMSKKVPKRFPISVLVRKHNQWKALKLAGALAVFNCHKAVTKQDLIHAISYIELIDGDMAKFETELVKEKYEVFCDYMKSLAVDGEATITLHALKKMAYITGTGAPATRMKELVDMCTSYDPLGTYTIDGHNINYKAIVKTEVTGGSFLPVDNSGVRAAIANKEGPEAISRQKQLVAGTTVAGYSYAETTFTNLKNLLSNDLAFTPFNLKTEAEGAKISTKTRELYKQLHEDYPEDFPTPKVPLGVRGKENIKSGTTWVCFDVDKTALTDQEVHEILEDTNHHIARTSDPDNDKKYRVIVQLDAPVDLGVVEWKFFIESVSDYLGLPIDKLAQSQIFFGYAGRKVLSVIDQNPIEIKDHITYALKKASEKGPEPELSAKEKSAKLATPYSTFELAFNAPNGQGSRSLHSAARKAYYKLGASKEEVITLVNEISDFWDSPFPKHRLEALESQIRDF